MTSDEILKWAVRCEERPVSSAEVNMLSAAMSARALAEIAYQLAKLNEHINELIAVVPRSL